MDKKGVRYMADGGLLGAIKAMAGKREKVLAETEKAAVGLRSPDPTPAPAAPVQKPITVEEAKSKMARFKWERENPGKPFVPGKKDGGMITGKGGPTEDKETVRVSPGEFIVPADTTAVFHKQLKEMVKQTHTPVAEKGLRGFANGFDPFAEYGPEIERAKAEAVKESMKQRASRASTKAANYAQKTSDGVRRWASRVTGPTLNPSSGSFSTGGTDVNWKQISGPAQSPRTYRDAIKGMARLGMRGVERVTPFVAPVVEGFDTAKDVMTPGVDNTLRAARVAEGVGRVAAASAGGMAGAGLGTAVAPGIGTVIGGVLGAGAGYFAPDAVSTLASKLTGEDMSMPSSRIDDVRTTNPTTAPWTPGGTPATGDFTDQNDRKLRQGVRLPMQDDTPAALPNGTGVVSNGTRQMSVDAPGMPDTIGAANAAARAEMMAMDARKEAEATGLRRQWSNERMQNDLRYAQYERDAAKTGTDSKFGGKRLAQANMEVSQAEKAIALAQNNQTEIDKNQRFTDAMKYGRDQGLRGTIYTANKTAESNELNKAATLSAAMAKARTDAQTKTMEQQNKNSNERDTWLKRSFSTTQVDPDTGKQSVVENPEAENDFRNFIVSYAAGNPAFAKANGGKSIDDMTKTDLEPVMRKYKEQMHLTANANSAMSAGNPRAVGLPTGAKTQLMQWDDLFGSGSNIGLLRGAKAILNPFNSGETASRTVKLKFDQGGVMQEQTFALDDILKGNSAAAKALIDTLPKEQGDELTRMLRNEEEPKGIRR